jgi:hypothetical protein
MYTLKTNQKTKRKKANFAKYLKTSYPHGYSDLTLLKCPYYIKWDTK